MPQWTLASKHFGWHRDNKDYYPTETLCSISALHAPFEAWRQHVLDDAGITEIIIPLRLLVASRTACPIEAWCQHMLKDAGITEIIIPQRHFVASPHCMPHWSLASTRVGGRNQGFPREKRQTPMQRGIFYGKESLGGILSVEPQPRPIDEWALLLTRERFFLTTVW